jgi:hypothetical protein
MTLKAGNINVETKTDPEDLSIPVVTDEPMENDKYVIRIEGELIVNVNRKSDYLRDVLDLD